MTSAGVDNTATPWQCGGGGCMEDAQRFPSPSCTGATRLPWDPDPALGTSPGPQGRPQQPQCTSMHQYTPTLPARKKAVTPPRQQIPRGHLGKPPAPLPPFNFFARSKRDQPLIPSPRAPGATRCHRIRCPGPCGREARPAAGREVTPGSVPEGVLTQEGAGDVLGDLVPRAAGLREVRQLPVQHPFELRAAGRAQRCWGQAGPPAARPGGLCAAGVSVSPRVMGGLRTGDPYLVGGHLADRVPGL